MLSNAAKKTKIPSIPQMLNRMNAGHAELLRATRDQREVNGSAQMTTGSLRGYRRCYDTLLAWECITNDGHLASKGLTSRGEDLLAVYDDRRTS